MTVKTMRRAALFSAASALGLLATPSFAIDPTGPEFAEESPGIIVNDNLDPFATPPAGPVDSGVNGVGQMITDNSPGPGSVGLCTGTLINPRTVIFAAHCVNSRPASAYGPNGTPFGAWTNSGTPISFGFQADNFPAAVTWITNGWQSDPSQAIYNVEHVWYDTRSLAPNSFGFLQADVAIATLDTPAFDVPTWTMLFSPIDGPTLAILTGYGGLGTNSSGNLGIDFRRRIATNIVAFLGSLDDRDNFLFGPGNVDNPANLYFADFTSPGGWDPLNGNFDFGLYGGPAEGNVFTTFEGTTAGGDSGGPLIVQQDGQLVTIGVLSGGTRFFGAQGFDAYGTDSFYQPLHAYWDLIVANNPYKYVEALEGNGDWEDPDHWIQVMDPNYAILVGGNLVNSLPDTLGEGITGDGAKFGNVCFLGTCVEYQQDAAVGDGTPVFVEGGPGSTGFVPDNVVANPSLGIDPRYYDVTLSAAGTTTLSSEVTIDWFTLDGGATKLNVAEDGTLNIWGEYNQFQGWTNVDGTINTGRDMFILSGLLSGNGTVASPFVTVIAGVVAPGGGDSIGTLTVDGNMIMSELSALFVDATRGGADLLDVTGILALDGGSVVFNKVGKAPRHGETYVIASADGGLFGTFGSAYTFQGVLRPELTYDGNNVYAELRAGSLVEIIGQNDPTARAFASALDSLRGAHYNSLYNLYGEIDWMNGDQLTFALNGLSPKVVGDSISLQDRQSKLLTSSVTDRLSLIANGNAKGLSIVGTPSLAMQARSQGVSNGKLGFGARHGGATQLDGLAGNVTGFIAGGVDRTESSYGSAGLSHQGGYHLAMGLEVPLAGDAVIGTAAGFAEGESTPGSDRDSVRTTMAAAYAAVPLGGGAYVGGMLSAQNSRTSVERLGFDGVNSFTLNGATDATRYMAVAEAGYEARLGGGLTLTPRAQLAYSRYSLDGFREAGGETALAIDDITSSRLEARLGARLGGAMKLGSVRVTPNISAEYVQLLSGRNIDATVRFNAVPDAAINLPIASSAKGYGEVKGGVTFERDNWAFGLSGQMATADTGLNDERAQADLKIRF